MDAMSAVPGDPAARQASTTDRNSKSVNHTAIARPQRHAARTTECRRVLHRSRAGSTACRRAGAAPATNTSPCELLAPLRPHAPAGAQTRATAVETTPTRRFWKAPSIATPPPRPRSLPVYRGKPANPKSPREINACGSRYPAKARVWRFAERDTFRVASSRGGAAAV